MKQVVPFSTFFAAQPFGENPQAVTEGVAYGIPALDKGLQIIAEGVAEAAPMYVVDGETPPIVGRPTAQIAMEFWSEATRTLILHGNYIALIHREHGLASELLPVHPTWCRVWRKQDGSVGYLVNGVEWNPTNVLHVKGLVTSPGDVRGIGILERHKRALGGALDVMKYSQSAFRNGGPLYYLQVGAGANEMYTDQAEMDALAEYWGAKYNQASAEPAYLPPEITVHPLGWNPDDMTLESAKKLSNEDMALMLGLDSYDLGGVTSGGSTIVYQNVTDRRSARYQDAIAPYLGRWEEHWRDLTGLPCRFDRESLTALDKKGTADHLKIALEALSSAGDDVDRQALALLLGIPLKAAG